MSTQNAPLYQSLFALVTGQAAVSVARADAQKALKVAKHSVCDAIIAVARTASGPEVFFAVDGEAKAEAGRLHKERTGRDAKLKAYVDSTYLNTVSMLKVCTDTLPNGWHRVVQGGEALTTVYAEARKAKKGEAKPEAGSQGGNEAEASAKPEADDTADLMAAINGCTDRKGAITAAITAVMKHLKAEAKAAQKKVS